MTLPYDIARCANRICWHRSDCLRFVSPGRADGLQSYADFPGGPSCEGRIAANLTPTARIGRNMGGSPRRRMR